MTPIAVDIVDFVAGAQSARGLAVVIDVFRAFSLAAYAFSRNVASIIPVADIDDALALKKRFPAALLVGERHARPLPGFDTGNSPTDLQKFDLAGQTLIHTTHAGTQGLTRALEADEVITGALVNAAAIVRYIEQRRPSRVTIVRMGQAATSNCAEDDLCAELLAARLRGENPRIDDIPARLRTADSARKFFDPACDWAPEEDFHFCTRADVFDFVLQLDRSRPVPALRRVDVPRQ